MNWGILANFLNFIAFLMSAGAEGEGASDRKLKKFLRVCRHKSLNKKETGNEPAH